MNTTEDYEIMLGEAIRQVRIGKGIPLEEVAERASLSPASVRALELGRGSTVKTLVKVLRILEQTRLITDFFENGKTFSPVAALREVRGGQRTPKRVSRKRS